MDTGSQFLDSPYLEEMFLFESEENTTPEDESDEEACDVDGYSTSEESDDDEDIPIVPICIENTCLKKAKLELEGDPQVAAKV